MRSHTQTKYLLNPSNFKIIIFDLGGVIIDLHVDQTVKHFSEALKKSEEEVAKAHQEADFFLLYEKGLISDDQFYLALNNHFQTTVDHNTLSDAWNAMLGKIVSEKIDFIQQLQNTYECWVLSNTNAIHERKFNQILMADAGYKRLHDVFDKVYFSHELNMRKPDAEIFEHILTTNRVEPGDAVFLDDSEENIRSAQKVGMGGIHIPRNADFRDYLKDW